MFYRNQLAHTWDVSSDGVDGFLSLYGSDSSTPFFGLFSDAVRYYDSYVTNLKLWDRTLSDSEMMLEVAMPSGI